LKSSYFAEVQLLCILGYLSLWILEVQLEQSILDFYSTCKCLEGYLVLRRLEL